MFTLAWSVLCCFLMFATELHGKHGGVLQQNHVPQWLLSIRGQFRAVWNVTTPGPPEITTFLLVIFGIARGAACSLLAPSQGHRRAHLARSLSSRGRTRRGSSEAAQVKLAEAYIQGHYKVPSSS